METLLQPGRKLGKHAIIDLSGCNSEIIRDCKLIHNTLVEAAKMARLTVIGIMDHRFMPEGYTAVLMLEESHLSIHTWPEHNYASIDLYSCNLQTDFQVVIDFLANEFQATVTEVAFLERGFSEACDINRCKRLI
ncbi:MAG TPA: adenosylmethionine decarboxylase [Anaerolineae bacterium]